jgi:hypothetical protein
MADDAEGEAYDERDAGRAANDRRRVPRAPGRRHATKKSVYERERLPELWLVDSDASVVLVFRRSTTQAPTFDLALELDRAATLASPLLPDFALGVGALFEFGWLVRQPPPGVTR